MRDQGETEGDTDIAVYSREEEMRDRLRSSRDRAEGKDWSGFFLRLAAFGHSGAGSRSLSGIPGINDVGDLRGLVRWHHLTPIS